MHLTSGTKRAFLFLGDVVVLYASLLLTIALRYGFSSYGSLVLLHLWPFSIVFILWLGIFFSAGLYDLPRLRNNIEFLKTFFLAVAVATLLTITLFYLIPSFFGIAPKTNLFLFVIIFGILEGSWRHAWNVQASFREGLVNVLLLGASPAIESIYGTLTKNPQFGYAVAAWLTHGVKDKDMRRLESLVREHQVNLIVIPHRVRRQETMKTFYALLTLGIEVQNHVSFYELLHRKAPLEELDEEWFIEHLGGHHRFYDDLKRTIEFFAALALFTLLLPLEILIALSIRLTSRGPAIYTQSRVGQHGRTFTLYKFRTMRVDAEHEGAKWSHVGDPRVTVVGRFLRATHLDELPQLANIVKGELSFVGPRPERPEFISLLTKEVPFYEIRHIVKPGITGWAQINYRYGSSVEDAKRKLEYDLYYIKHRSLIMDGAIILKTLKLLFVNPA